MPTIYGLNIRIKEGSFLFNRIKDDVIPTDLCLPIYQMNDESNYRSFFV